ncbi:MAG: 6-hydroxymethylpterin diphosphokinase MptE-like protein [Paenibacillaceae bacterium]
MLIDNVALIKSKLPKLWQALEDNKDQFNVPDISIELAKNGLPNIKVQKDNRSYYIHSKYDPMNEADAFIQQFDDIESYEHVFFYGIGMGYHVEAFLKRYPKTYFTLYEPNPAMFYHYLEHRLMNDLPLKFMKNLYLEWTPNLAFSNMAHFLENFNERILFVPLGSYERIYPEKAKQFSDDFKRAMSGQRSSLGVGMRFEKHWTYNSIVNFEKVLETGHVIREKKEVFKNKPVLLVAAGPSLEDEIENLKMIKQNGLAYIISVGSAIKALLKNGIYPDAVSAYDPETGLEGLDVFQEVIEENISSIPLIFGSTLGFNTVNRYTGPLLHVFINQDTVSPFYLGMEQAGHSGGIVSDAPSIAIVTLEVLAKLGCNPIILVGQNLSFRNDQYYASGIQYLTRANAISESEKPDLVFVESVDGGTVSTSKNYVPIKENMELYISQMPHIEIINTTQGGALIKGTKFALLEQLISNRLKDKVVDEHWYEGSNTDYDKAYITSQAQLMDREYRNATKYMDTMVNVFRTMDKLATSNDANQMNKQFPIFDKNFKKLQSNHYFNVFIKPSVRVQMQMLQRVIPEVREQSDPLEKSRKVIQTFGKFIFECQRAIQLMDTEFKKLQSSLLAQSKVAQELKAK